MEFMFNLARYAHGVDLHGKRLVLREPPTGFGEVKFRTEAGASRVWNMPLRLYPALFLEFAALKKRAAAIQQFVNTYGTIGLAGQFMDKDIFRRPMHKFLPRVEWGDDEYSSVERWYPEINDMKKSVTDWQSQGFPNPVAPNYVTMFARGTVGHRWDKDSAVHLIFFPDNLLDALWLQFYEAVASGVAPKFCRKCEKPFLCGKGTAKRSRAEFCTPTCKRKYFNDKRAKKAEKLS